MDEKRVYDKLEQLAVGQAAQNERQIAAEERNDAEHGAINKHLKTSNGNMAHLQE